MSFNIRKKQEKQKKSVFYFPSGNQFAPEIFEDRLRTMVTQVQAEKGKKGCMILCIGSDRSTGDSLGPLVGHKLYDILRNDNKDPRDYIMGTLEKPVHAMNLEEAVNIIESKYSDRVIIAVDASIGKKENVGLLTLNQGAIKPGQGVSKDLIEAGDIGITGIVGSESSLDQILLQNVRLSLIMNMADCIVEGISGCITREIQDCPDFANIPRGRCAVSVENFS